MQMCIEYDDNVCHCMRVRRNNGHNICHYFVNVLHSRNCLNLADPCAFKKQHLSHQRLGFLARFRFRPANIVGFVFFVSSPYFCLFIVSAEQANLLKNKKYVLVL